MAHHTQHKKLSLGKHWPLLPPPAKNPAKLLQFLIFLLLENRVSDPDPDPFGNLASITFVYGSGN